MTHRVMRRFTGLSGKILVHMFAMSFAITIYVMALLAFYRPFLVLVSGNAPLSPIEKLHMNDVYALFLLNLSVLLLSFPVVRTSLKPGIETLLIFAIILLTFLDFGNSFIAFHKLLFTNSYWILPADSWLITNFPERFFMLSFGIVFAIYLSILAFLFFR